MADYTCTVLNGLPWRIEPESLVLSGLGPKMVKQGPEKFATIKYVDTDNMALLNKILYDLNGDKAYGLCRSQGFKAERCM